MLVRLSAIVGSSTDPEVAEALHRLGHHGAVEYLVLDENDMARRRLRMCTDRGTECAIALARDLRLQNGSVLELTATRAIVVQLDALPALVIRAPDRPGALRLGFLAGHLHWRVKFEDDCIRVSMDGPREDYLERLREHLPDGAYQIREDD